MKKVYTSSQQSKGAPGYPERSGQLVDIVRPLTPAEADEEVRPMYRIRFSDGVETDAFGNEVSDPPRSMTEPTIVLIQSQEQGQTYQLGSVSYSGDLDTGPLLADLWDKWREENPTPDADSDFIPWLIQLGEGFAAAPEVEIFTVEN